MKVKEQVGLGFIFLDDHYNNNDVIKDAFAKTYLNLIFYESELNIEQLLHSIFSNKEAILKYGLNAFIADYIRDKDNFLAEYVFARKELIQPILKDFNKALNNWQNFEEQNENNRIDIIYDKAKKYYEDYGKGIRFTYIDAVYYIAKKLGYQKRIDNYNLITYYKDYEEFYDNDITLILMFENEFNLSEISFLKYLEELMKESFTKKIVVEDFDDYVIPEPKETKFFDFPKSRVSLKKHK